MNIHTKDFFMVIYFYSYVAICINSAAAFIGAYELAFVIYLLLFGVVSKSFE